MKIFAVIGIDVDDIATLAKHRQQTPAAVAVQLRDLLEGCLVDSIQHVDGVMRPVSSRVEIEA